MLAPSELLPTDLAGVGPLACVGAHVALEDALVHGRETAVRALELLPDDRELIDWKTAQRASPVALEPALYRPPRGLAPTRDRCPKCLTAGQKAKGSHVHSQTCWCLNTLLCTRVAPAEAASTQKPEQLGAQHCSPGPWGSAPVPPCGHPRAVLPGNSCEESSGHSECEAKCPIHSRK